SGDQLTWKDAECHALAPSEGTVEKQFPHVDISDAKSATTVDSGKAAVVGDIGHSQLGQTGLPDTKPPEFTGFMKHAFEVADEDHSGSLTRQEIDRSLQRSDLSPQDQKGLTALKW